MDRRRRIHTTIPLAPSLINEYCKDKRDPSSDGIVFVFDIKECPLKSEHILGYLANLKVDFRVVNIDEEFLVRYMQTDFFVGNSNLIQHHANFLYYHKFRTLLFDDPELMSDIAGNKLIYNFYRDCNEVGTKESNPFDDQMKVIRSLPKFLVHCCGTIDELRRAAIIGPIVKQEDKLKYCGANIARLIDCSDDLLLQLIADKVFNFEQQLYYSFYFDKFYYNQTKLIAFFQGSDNVINSVIETVIM